MYKERKKRKEKKMKTCVISAWRFCFMIGNLELNTIRAIIFFVF